MKLILFDIDGTLLWTDGAGRRAVARALEAEAAFPGSLKGYRFDGKTDFQIIRDLLTAACHPHASDAGQIEAFCRRYVELLRQELAAAKGRVRTLPGVPALLDAIEADPGMTLGLVTGNVAEGARLKLDAAGLDIKRFRVAAFGSDSVRRDELSTIAAARAAQLFGASPRGSEMVVVGDTPADIACGQAVGATTIAVATGFYAAESLRSAGADYVFENLTDTQGVLGAARA